MVAHRNVHHFGPRIQQNIVIKRTINIPQPHICQTGFGGGMGTMDSIFMAMGAFNMLGGVVGDLVGNIWGTKSPQAETPTANNPNHMANLTKLVGDKGYTIIDEGNGKFTVDFNDGTSITDADYETARNTIIDKKNKKPVTPSNDDGKSKVNPNTVPEGLGGDDPPKETYNVKEIKQDFESYTIKAQKQADGKIKGDTWSSLALSKYDIPQGVTLKDVYTALAKANYSGNDFASAMTSKGGIQFKAGDQIKLPKELNVNGQTVKLKEDWKSSDVRSTYGTVTSNFHAATVKQVGSKWQVVNSKGVQQGSLYNTQAEANAAADKLNKGDET